MNKKNAPKSPRILQVRQDRDYDCVYVKGKKIMLGRTGSPEAEVASGQLYETAVTFKRKDSTAVNSVKYLFLREKRKDDMNQ